MGGANTIRCLFCFYITTLGFLAPANASVPGPSAHRLFLHYESPPLIWPFALHWTTVTKSVSSPPLRPYYFESSNVAQPPPLQSLHTTPHHIPFPIQPVSSSKKRKKEK